MKGKASRMKSFLSKIIVILGLAFLLILPALVSTGTKWLGPGSQAYAAQYAAKKAGGGDFELSLREAYPINLDSPSPGIAGRLRLNLNDLLVVEGPVIQLLQNLEGTWQPKARFHNGSEILHIQEGAVQYQILVLDRSGLQVIDFQSFDQPEILGRYPVNNSRLTRAGHLVERFGSYAYVLDSSIHGFKVLDFKQPHAIELVGEFSGSLGVPTDIQIRNHTVYLLTPGELLGIAVGDFLDPKPKLAGKLRLSGAAKTMAMGINYAFIADGARLKVVNINPDSPEFLKGVTSRDVSFPIDAVLVHDDRVYLMDAAGALDIVEFPTADRR